MLEQILQNKRREVETRRGLVSLRELKARTADLLPPLDFKKAITRGPGEGIKAIAEIKRASPSAGILREDFNPEGLALAYAKGGASAISVLTDEAFFQGSLRHIEEVRGAVELPILRKDFIIDPYQVFETRAALADALLLIVATLEPSRLQELLELALELQLHPLVEVHTEEELTKALEAGANLIGINNRDLRTFRVSLETTFSLFPHIPPGKVVVSESGIQGRNDVVRLSEAGLDAILAGEALLREADPAVKLRELLGR
ncbi:MAG: indole-3-glycerol phosphate synthase TrpC [Candidatus Methylomirabilales bacterium]